MSSAVSSSQNKESVVSDDQQLVVNIAEEEEEDTISSNENCSQKGSLMVTSHLYLKPAHSTSASLDKQVILHRIRHRKRVNQVRAAVQSFLGSFSSSYKPPAHKSRWPVDDPFAAP